LPDSLGGAGSVSFATAINVPRLTRRIAPSVVLAAGFVLLTVGIGWLSFLTPDTPYLIGVAIPMFVYGIGQGLALGPLTGAGVAGASGELAGAASGMINAAQQLGGTVGIAVLVAVTATSGQPLTVQVTTAFTGGAVLAACGLIAALVLIIPGERADRARQISTAPHIAPTDPAATSS
jgi:MFS family permease